MQKTEQRKSVISMHDNKPDSRPLFRSAV